MSYREVAIAVICCTLFGLGWGQQPGYRVSGRVVDEATHRPLAGAKVALLLSQAGQERRQVVESGTDGSFAFAGIGAGKYDLYAEAPGYAQQALNAHENFLTGVAAGPGKDSEGIVFGLGKEAVIEGVVLDEAGEAVRDANVVLFRKSFTQGSEQVRVNGNENSDDRGMFVFHKLAPGTYYLAVNARPWYASGQYNYQVNGVPKTGGDPALDVVYPLTFFGGATDENAAQAISLRAGQRTEANVTLFPTPGLHVKVRGVGENSPNIFLQRRVFGQWRVPMNLSMSRSGEGEMMMNGVAPGHYIARVMQFNRQTGSGQRRMNPMREFPVEITGDTEIDPAEAPAAAQVTGMVQLPVEAAKGNRLIIFRRDGERGAPNASGQLDAQGHFKDVELAPGRYSIIVIAGQSPYQAQSIAVSGAAKAMGRQIEFSSGPASLAIVAGNERGEISGTVTQHGKAMSGAMVLLVPREGLQEKDRIARDESDSDGTFTLRGVAPGSYQLVALRNGWTMEWGKQEILAPYLKNSVTVEIGGRGRGEVRVEAQ